MTDIPQPARDDHQLDAGFDAVDPTLARASLVYDYLLGGARNSSADRSCAKQLLTVLPNARIAARHNKEFLDRAVTYVLDRGIRQFLDLGSGLLAAGALHERAVARHRECRVVYVDNEPVVVSQGHVVLAGRLDAAMVFADITHPDKVLVHADVLRMLDFTEPMAVLLGATLDFVPDSADPAGLVGSYAAVCAPGSYLVLSHATADDVGQQMTAAAEIYNRIGAPQYPRTRAEVTSLLAGIEHLVHPGVVHTCQWHPDNPTDLHNPADSLSYGAVAYLD